MLHPLQSFKAFNIVNLSLLRCWYNLISDAKLHSRKKEEFDKLGLKPEREDGEIRVCF